MSNEVNFDALTQATMDAAEGQQIAALDNLYGHAFALPNWNFIARGEYPNITPYAASTEGFANGAPMFRAFTDLERLQRFVKEQRLDGADGQHMVINIPTEKIVDYLEQFVASGVFGLWFNSDSGSTGFFVPLQQLRAIKQHLQQINWKAAP